MKILVCSKPDNAKECRQKLELLEKKHTVNMEIGLAFSVEQLLFNVESQHTDVDIIYLDYNLDDGNGIDAANILRSRGVESDIIFYTDDENHMAEGYDVDAMNYLVRNKVSSQKFEKVFLKAVQRAGKKNEEVLSLYCAGENRKISIDSILFFEVHRRIVTVHYGDNETFDFYSTLSKLSEMLCGKGFVRIHQAFLVSEKYIHRSTKKAVVMADKTTLPIGRSYQGKI